MFDDNRTKKMDDLLLGEYLMFSLSFVTHCGSLSSENSDWKNVNKIICSYDLYCLFGKVTVVI